METTIQNMIKTISEEVRNELDRRREIGEYIPYEFERRLIALRILKCLEAQEKE